MKDGVRNSLRSLLYAQGRRKERGIYMHIDNYGKNGIYYKEMQEYWKENNGAQGNPFQDYINRAEEKGNSYYKNYGGKAKEDGAEEQSGTEEEEWREKLRKWDEEMERIREQNRRERERLTEERLRKKRIRKKLWEKLALKKYLARQDEIMQMNEKISLERAVGEDVYIEKAPLSKSLSVAEIMAICSKF